MDADPSTGPAGEWCARHDFRCKREVRGRNCTCPERCKQVRQAPIVEVVQARLGGGIEQAEAAERIAGTAPGLAAQVEHAVDAQAR